MTEHTDLLVVGGGIHGTGVAQAAAAAGYSVILVEKSRLAAGTSSRSSKLIHGGLRYLETYQFRVVRECLRERSILLRMAPELVRMETFNLPVYEGSRRPPWLIATGLGLYAALAGFGAGSGFSRLSGDELDTLPGLRREGLKAVFRFRDARTDDRELTRAVMASAVSMGARLWQDTECVAVRLTDEGAVAAVRGPGRECEIQCRVVVNAAGPWVGELLARVTPGPPVPPFELIQGTHIVLRPPVVDRCFYMENPRDGRGVFFLPWRDATLVGTTETRFRGPPDRVAPRKSEIRYLRKLAGHFFPAARGVPGQSVRSFAGLRVLPAGGGHAFQRSRETRLVGDQARKPRLISIFGGKLTAYRATAEKVMASLRPRLPESRRPADTASIRLEPAGNEFPDE